MITDKSAEFSRLSAKIDAGIRKAYRKLVEKEAKEGGTLIFSINGKITEVPATELLKDLQKAP